MEESMPPLPPVSLEAQRAVLGDMQRACHEECIGLFAGWADAYRRRTERIYGPPSGFGRVAVYREMGTEGFPPREVVGLQVTPYMPEEGSPEYIAVTTVSVTGKILPLPDFSREDAELVVESARRLEDLMGVLPNLAFDLTHIEDDTDA